MFRKYSREILFWAVKNSKTDVTKICYTLHTYVHMYPIQWPGHDITVPPWSKFMHIKQNIQKCILYYVYPKSIYILGQNINWNVSLKVNAVKILI